MLPSTTTETHVLISICTPESAYPRFYDAILSTKYFDDESELAYFGYRYYSPELGRWTSRDPVGAAAGPGLYVFVLNRPVNGYDSNGLGILELLASFFDSDPEKCRTVFKPGLDSRYERMETAYRARLRADVALGPLNVIVVELNAAGVSVPLDIWGAMATDAIESMIGNLIVGVFINIPYPSAELDYVSDYLLGEAFGEQLSELLFGWRSGSLTISDSCGAALTALNKATFAAGNSRVLEAWWKSWGEETEENCRCLYEREKGTINRWKNHWHENYEDAKGVVDGLTTRVESECGFTPETTD